MNFRIEDAHVEVEAQVDTVDRTGVEMEALTACAVAALTIYDMCKSIDRSMTIGELALWEKTGGRSGHLPPARRGSTTSPTSSRPASTARGLWAKVRHGREAGGRRLGSAMDRRSAGYIRSSGGTTGAFALTIAVILILGVLWVAVLVPPILRARGQQSRSDSVGDFTYKLTTLGRANGSHREPPSTHVVPAADVRARWARAPRQMSAAAEAPPRRAVRAHRRRRRPRSSSRCSPARWRSSRCSSSPTSRSAATCTC